MNRLEGWPFQPVEPLPALLAHLDRTDFSEHAQVLRDLWLGEADSVDQLVDGLLPPASASRICRRRGSATALNASVVVAARAIPSTIYSYIGICQIR